MVMNGITMPARQVILANVRRIVSMVISDTPHQLYLFGSFADGKERPSSDIDIAIEAAQQIQHSTMVKLRDCLDESNIPYRVDVIDLRNASPQLEREIRRGGILWTD